MATKNIVPRANGEGNLGTAEKTWDKVYTNDVILPEDKSLNEVLAGKLDKNQGVENAGKALEVGEDGLIKLGDGGGHLTVDALPSAEEAKEKVVYFVYDSVSKTMKGYIKYGDAMVEIGKNDGVPIGTICSWPGTIDNIPEGFLPNDDGTIISAKEIRFADMYLQSYVGWQSVTYKRVSLPIPNKTSITIPAFLTVAVGNKIFTSAKDVVLNLNDFVTNRAGKDLYIYACDNNGELAFVISENSTVPSGYTATTSRKIGGFHCLCVNVGTIAGHTLSDYAAGDILPLSVWDLLHRAVSSNEGMVYVNGKWYDIYLISYDGSKCVSVYGGACADGDSSVKFHGEKFVEMLGLVGKRLIKCSEFMVVAKGSNEQTNISGSKDYGTTGGHVDTNNRRMISNYGLEDCCGFMWQWTEDVFDSYNGTTSWNSNNYYLDGYSWQQKSVYNPDIDNQGYGSCIGLLRRCVVGGHWDDGANCGSRSSHCGNFSSNRDGNVGGRSASEPRVVNL